MVDIKNNERKILKSISTIRLIERRAKEDLLEINIQTSRPHKIRIHLASIGTPLIGDKLYKPYGYISNLCTPGEGGYSLHAFKIENLIIKNKIFNLIANPPINLQVS